ncbi:TIGR00282 family metallophosphoesterase [Curvivirga aplysinae]|uniref:TIGR00282 family metallophosphoesterase n=1 Tax=Curvivirga aplysinae TaxID=2529852 RepID=UPI0012BD1756|nr:TIGR00282 family metallophosphoesterase [Curvivirga aplysinae]MTI09125.1 YmdB family metallophosphoesterase [Curvivirga aplysinae]
MRFLFLGDIVGKAGRRAVQDYLPDLRDELKLDFVVANGENAAHGFGLTESTANDLFDAGVDSITSGNHAWDKIEVIGLMERDDRIIRPANFAEGSPGKGGAVYQTSSGHSILVINVMGRLFMEPLDNPWEALDRLLPPGLPGDYGLDAVLVDFHAEATSEKYTCGHYCDGRASLVVGTHTHVPTGDAQILENGTGYQTDAGMCGDYDSIIGMGKDECLARNTGTIPKPRLSPAEGDGTLCGVFVETDPKTGLASRCESVRVGPRLHRAVPIVD